MGDPAREVTDQLRAELRAAMVARDRETTTVLRSAIAAIDHAQAVPMGTVAATVGRSGDVPRRVLSVDEVNEVLRGEVRERETAAAEYRALGQPDAADRLDVETRTLTGFLAAR